MSQNLELQLSGQSKAFVTKKEYQEFTERFQKEVKSELDKQQKARLRSEDRAKRHLLSE